MSTFFAPNQRMHKIQISECLWHCEISVSLNTAEAQQAWRGAWVRTLRQITCLQLRHVRDKLVRVPRVEE